jgi:NAD(P)-dependent dehydrogenase (short-subunit alcohol dehydrogenase family)
VLSGVRLSRHYLPAMKKRNWGRIVFVSSESAVQIPSEMIHYGMTKTAQVAIARGMAETTTGTNVTVNTVLPGAYCLRRGYALPGGSRQPDKKDAATGGAGILPDGAPHFAPTPLRAPNRNRGHGRVPEQSAELRNQRGGVARRWWRYPVDPLAVVRRRSSHERTLRQVRRLTP